MLLLYKEMLKLQAATGTRSVPQSYNFVKEIIK